MVKPTCQKGKLNSAMIGAPALTTPAVQKAVKLVQATLKVPGRPTEGLGHPLMCRHDTHGKA